MKNILKVIKVFRKLVKNILKVIKVFRKTNLHSSTWTPNRKYTGVYILHFFGLCIVCFYYVESEMPEIIIINYELQIKHLKKLYKSIFNLRFSSTLFYFLFYYILFCSTWFYFILFSSILFYSILFRSITFILFYYIHFVLWHSFCSITLYFVLFCYITF